MGKSLASRLGGFSIAVLVTSGIDVSAAVSHSSNTPCSETDARQFDFWVGDWNVHNRNRQPGSDNPAWFDTGEATDRVESVLDRCAVIELWRGRLTFGDLLGFSLRAFNPLSHEWDLLLLWPPPDHPRFGLLHGSFHHRRGEFFFDSADAEGRPIRNRYTFSDISRESLRWDSAVSSDKGLSWKTTWIMEFTRRSTTAAPLPDIRSEARDRCDFPEIRQLDFLEGRWWGTTTFGGSQRPVSLESLPILGGCGAMDLLEIGAGSDDAVKEIHVRTYQPSTKTWVEYRLDTRRRVIYRLDGTFEDGTATLRGELETPDGPLKVDSQWHERAEHEVGWSVRMSEGLVNSAAETKLEVVFRPRAR